MGPITLFDKSFLQSLSTDEAVWFDYFFYPVVCPLFFIETLADLLKNPRPGKSPEEEVGIIAAKTPEIHGGVCHFHHALCIQDLLGNHPPMNGTIPVAGIRQVFRDGKEGGVAEVSEEAKAFERWKHGDFFDLERFHAKKWRSYVQNINLSSIERLMKMVGVTSKTCKSLEAALNFADEVVSGLTRSSERFNAALLTLGIPDELGSRIKQSWKSKGKQKLTLFAPYAAHVLRVELFFRAALGANLIASTRSSHKIDMAYLNYLPFCMVFVSNDKLHKQCAPLFLRSDQSFVWGSDLKSDLTSLNDHFKKLPEETRKQGIYKFANHLPEESQGVIRQLFESHTPRLLKKSSASIEVDKIKKDAHKKIFDEMKKWESASSEGSTKNGTMDTLIIKRSISKTRGSWVQVPPKPNE